MKERAYTRGYMCRHRLGDLGQGLGVAQPTWGAQPVSRNPPVRDFSLGGRDGRPVERFESRPQLLALATDGDRPLDWLRAGQARQRALLEAAHHGVMASFLTQSLELTDSRHESRRWPGSWPFAETPQMIIRVGYPARRTPMKAREARPDVVDFRTHPRRHVQPPDLDPSRRS